MFQILPVTDIVWVTVFLLALNEINQELCFSPCVLDKPNCCCLPINFPSVRCFTCVPARVSFLLGGMCGLPLVDW